MPYEVKTKSLHHQRFSKLDKVRHKDVITMFNRLGTHVSDNSLPETNSIVFEPVRVLKTKMVTQCVTIGFNERERPISKIVERMPIKKIIDFCTTVVSHEMPSEESYSYI